MCKLTESMLVLEHFISLSGSKQLGHCLKNKIYLYYKEVETN